MRSRMQCAATVRGVRSVVVRTSLSRLILLSGLIVLFASLMAAPGWSQGTPAEIVRDYSLPHLFGLPTATTTRQFGMGGTTACVLDNGFANPAFAGALEQSHAGVRYSITEFDSGLQLKGAQGWLNTPVGDGQGVQLVGFWLDSDRGPVLPAPGANFVMAELYEGDISLHYGRRLSDTWLVGIGASPVFSTSTNIYHPTTGALLSRVDSSVDAGGRLGVLYQFAPEGFIGGVVDVYSEDVKMVGPGLPGAIMSEFDATQYALGVSGRVGDRVLLALEWAELKSESGVVENVASGWHAGIEFDINEQAKLRAGLDDGELTTGFGYESENWSANFAYIKDWNEDLVGAALGESDTSQIEITTSW